MAALPPLRASPRPPPAMAAAPVLHIRRPIHIHPLGRRGPPSALRKMQPPARDPFRFNCADNLCDPEPEPEQEPENHDPDKAATSGNCPLVDKFVNYVKAAKAEMGIRDTDTPDMFIKEKERLSSYEKELTSSSDNLDEEETVTALLVCKRAQEALNLASLVMDMASLRRGTIQFSHCTVGQMVRTYAAIFCNVAEDAYHKKFKMENALSFIGALRGLGAIHHILAQDTVANLKDSRFKKTITYQMGKHSKYFDKVVKYLEDVIVKIEPQEFQQTVNSVLLGGILRAEAYIALYPSCRED